MQAPLKKHAFTAQRVAMYASLLEDQLKSLIDGQAAAALTKLGLAERVRAVRERTPGTPATAIPELHPVSLAATLKSFYNALFTMGGALALPLLDRIADGQLRSETRASVAKQIA